MAYSVSQLSEVAGITVRTLHYYDEIGLLKPSFVGDNSYRYYDDDALLRLQQILFYRELGINLNSIAEIMDDPQYDLLEALQHHRHALQEKARRLQNLIQTVDSTILHIIGEVEMEKKQLFKGFGQKEEKRYAQEARQLYGEKEVDDSYRRWNSYSADRKEQIKAEGQAIYTELATMIKRDPASEEVHLVIQRWHQHLRHFYEPSVERLKGLGQLYVEHPDFARNFRQIDPNLPEFMQKAIDCYCERLAART